MAWAPVAGAIAGQLFSSLLADDGPDPELQNNFIREQGAANAALQREFAQNGIRWRVEDAKAAGLHPMYALTGGGAAFAPNPIAIGATQGASSPSGSSFGSAMEKALTAFFASQQKKDDVIGQAVQAVAAVAQSNSISAGPSPYSDGDFAGPMIAPPDNLQNAFDVQQFTKPQVLSRNSEDLSTTLGVGPGGTVHQLGPNFHMILPSSSSGGVAESLEALSESRELMYAYIHRNVEKYGEEWLDEAQKYFPVTSTFYRVIMNVRNAVSWVNQPGLTTLGHRTLPPRVMEILDMGRGPTVRGKIRR